ncbi:TOG array regulator of axonemal microtubules protein 1-like [Gadus chalcogrammus]|uniref:TOG array regulator of axonemal microtubules protein 1-like n=1 Tax=Gadus chalcogrammus TaxID=1042646 RepID=UPI0024C47A47|nr:TOG array regulator of axonemal microtubules protein 1-like [Gadus chalcogrammus]
MLLVLRIQLSSQAVSGIESLLATIEAMAASPKPDGKLSEFLAAMKKQRQQRGGEPGAGTFKYQEVTLSKGEAAELAEGQPISQCAPRLQRAIVLTCESTVKHLKNRFSSLLEENTKDAPTAKAVKCFNVFSHDSWADNRLELLNHGVEEVNFLLQHFSTVLDRNGCSKEKAKEEFQLMKMTINTSFKDKSYLGLWQVMTTKEPYCSDFAADGQEAWIQAAHSDTVSLCARALGAASSQETSPGRTPPVSFTVDLRDAPLSSASSSRNAAASARRRAHGGAEADLSGTERSQSANGQRSQAPGRIADGQEAWIQAAHYDTVSLRARALGAASSQETSPGQTPPVDLRDAPLSSAPSSRNAAASARRRALGGAEADLSGTERSQFANGQRSQAPGSPPASDVPEGVAGRGKYALSPFPPVQERLRNGRIPREKLRGPSPHQAGEEAGPSGKRQKNGGRCFPDQRLTAESELEEKLLDSSDEPAQGSLSGPQRDPPGPHPFPKPELAMTQSLTLISSENWQEKMEGLTVLRSLAQNHVDTLLPRLRDVCLALVQEVKNLRSGVSRVAVCTLGVLYCHLQRAMDKELDTTARALLHKAAESNAFIREEVDAALGHMVRHCTPARCINAFLDGGLSHLSAAVRKCAAQHLADLLERVGVARLLSGGKDVTDRILPAVVKLALDSSPEPRSFGRRMLLFLSSHRDFDSLLEKNIPTKDLSAARKAVSGLKAKVRKAPPSRPTLPLGYGEPNKYSSKPQGPIIEDKAEYIRQLTALLESKDFRKRIKGLDQLVADCQHNPSMVIRSLFPVFDLFRDRLLESNRKVNLYALEALQGMVRLLKDNLSGVLNHLVPAIVDNHLNSKNRAVYSAATGALCELVLNLDNSLLLEPFCFKARVLSGQAKVDLIEKVAELVMELYPRRPQLVEQKALPLLWGLLGPSSGSVHRATTSLCRALHHQMGPGLRQSAASQPPSVGRDLNQLLRTMS